MPDALRQISLFLPNTYPCQAMRDIMLRGWDIEREAVYMGVGFSSFRIPCNSSFTPYCVLSTVHHFSTILDIKSIILTLSLFFNVFWLIVSKKHWLFHNLKGRRQLRVEPIFAFSLLKINFRIKCVFNFANWLL